MKTKFPTLRFLAALLAGAAFSLTAAAEDDPIQIGYSFNEGSTPGSGPTDYYGVLDGAWTGNWEGSTHFHPGFSGEEGDYAYTSYPSGNRVRVHATDVLGEEWGSFTVEVHFTIGEAGHFRRLVDMEPFNRILQKNTANRLRTSIGGTIQTDVLEEDRWYHAAAVYNVEEGTGSLYLDGELVGSGESIDWVTPEPFHIGASETGGSNWNGMIDNFRLTAAALTPDEFLLEGFGTELTEPVPPPPPPAGAEEWQIFWTELDLGEIHTARGDNTARSVLATGLNRPIGIAADTENGHIYWSEDGVDSNTTGDGQIVRANLDGSEPVVLFAAQEGDAGLDNPQFIALNPEAGHIYWADHHNGIYRGSMDGSGDVTEIYENTSGRYTNIALDLTNDYVYFGDPQTSDFYRTDLDGGNFEFLTWELTNDWAFNGLAIDPATETIYFTDLGTIRSATIFGGNRQEIASDLDTPLGVVFGPEEGRLFFSERHGASQIGTVLTDGTGQQPLLTGLDSPFGLAVIQAAPPETQPFDQWRATYFNETELADSEISGPAADPAGDGISNLMKFALGMGDPKVPSRDALPMAEVSDGALHLTYPQAVSATDAELIVEVSTDLIDWQSGEDFVEILEVDDTEDPELITVRATPANGDSDRLFIRLNVIQAIE